MIITKSRFQNKHIQEQQKYKRSRHEYIETKGVKKENNLQKRN